MAEKIEVESKSAWLLMHPRHTVLVTCADAAGKPNIITLAWSMVTSFNPFMVAVSVGFGRYSHDLIQKGREFVVNIPGMDIVEETLFCGRNSGRDVDKFAATGLTPLPAKHVKPPLIAECVAHLECKLVQEMTTGDHTFFAGQVVAATVNEGIFDRGFVPEKIRPILHNGGDDFVTIDPNVVSPSRKL